MPDSDLALHRAWAHGDRSAGDRLIERYLGPIGRFFVNKVSDPTAADDLAAETFARVAKGLHGFRGESSVRTYVFGIARHLLLDHLRVRHRVADFDPATTALQDLSPSPSRRIGAKREIQLLLTGLRAIPLQSQVILELSYFERLTRDAIAEILECPPGTAASRLRRAREQLREALESLAESPTLLESTVHDLDDWAEQIARLIARVDPTP